jgi:hypothetical protein
MVGQFRSEQLREAFVKQRTRERVPSLWLAELLLWQARATRSGNPRETHQGIASRKIVQQRLERHASSGQAGRTPHNLRITRNSGVHMRLPSRKVDEGGKFEAFLLSL